jgi:hypothetical protein
VPVHRLLSKLHGIANAFADPLLAAKLRGLMTSFRLLHDSYDLFFGVTTLPQRCPATRALWTKSIGDCHFGRTNQTDVRSRAPDSTISLRRAESFKRFSSNSASISWKNGSTR